MELIRCYQTLVESSLFGENFGVTFQFLSLVLHDHFEGKHVCYEQFGPRPNRHRCEENLKIFSVQPIDVIITYQARQLMVHQ